ncbi:MAG: site-specific integrase [Myxococcaceae bacterium]|nr:site-specific integrase [Myxococcaceae bacterium]
MLAFKDGAGQWRQQRTKAATKAEARVMLRDIERRMERIRNGLEQLPDPELMTFGQLLDWWKSEYGERLKSPTVLLMAEKHLRGDLGGLTLQQVTPSAIEGLLKARESTLKPSTLNHLRALLHRIFRTALLRGRWHGANPASTVVRRKVPKRLPTFLKYDEVIAVLPALPEKWVAFFATAVYLGLRRGELIALRKGDVDLPSRTIAVLRSGEGDTTKGGHADLLPIPDALMPYLSSAFRSSPSEFVFPREDGSMLPLDVAVDKILRRTLGRVGIVDGYERRCRRRGCGFTEPRADTAEGRCPRCDMKLWLKSTPRHVRFHDLRHTTATLLLKQGVPLPFVQRILRHRDPALTTEIYGHLELTDLRAALNVLDFRTEEERINAAEAIGDEHRRVAGDDRTSVVAAADEERAQPAHKNFCQPMGHGRAHPTARMTQTGGSPRVANRSYALPTRGEHGSTVGVQVVAGSNPVAPTIGRP